VAGRLEPGDGGFTLIEMIVAISILAVTMLTIAYGLFGGMSVMQTTRNKTAMLELANAEAERLRALDYAEAGVNVNDPDIATAYPPVGGVNKFNGREAVVINPASPNTPPAVEVVTTTTASNRPTPYTIRRWVTWTDPTAGATQRFKRVDVRIEWNDPGGTPRKVDYTTLYYPGNLGRVTTPPPTATFTASPTVGFEDLSSFNFTATATDPAGLALFYAWDFGDGTTATGQSTSHVYSTVGRKTISLVVTNTAGVASTPVTQNVLVGTAPGCPCPPGNIGPVARFVATPTVGPGPLSVGFDASTSTDANGDPLTFEWVWGDGSSVGSGISAGHVYNDFGTYTVTLTVRDPAGFTSTATTSISVTSSTCRFTAASFKNPANNPVSNEIDTRGNSDKPVNSQFRFFATTSAVCTGVTARLPTQNGTFTATLALATSDPAVKTWAITTTDSSKYNTGNSQSGTFTATSPAPASPVNFTIAFRVF
jgi:prepilin-type N-terminal cleavage/methylation domain-containing protein